MFWLKLLNYSILAVVYYDFFYRVIAGDRPYFPGMCLTVFLSDLFLVLELWMNRVPALSGQLVQGLLSGAMMIIAMKHYFRESYRTIIFSCYIPCLVIISACELLCVLLISRATGIDIRAMINSSMRINFLVSLYIDVAELLVLESVAHLINRNRLKLLSRRELRLVAGTLGFQVLSLLMLSYHILLNRELSPFDHGVIWAAFILSNLGLVYLLYVIVYQQALTVKRNDLAFAQAKLASEIRDLESRDQEVDALQGEIFRAIRHLDDSPAVNPALKKQYEKFRNRTYTDNSILDALLRSYGLRFEQIQVHYTFQIRASMKDNLEPVEIVKVFSNLLDNAMEAVQGNDLSHRSIFLEVLGDHNVYRVILENDLPQHPVISRKKVHGEGIHILEEVMKAHHGTVAVRQGEGRYRMQLDYLLREDSHVSEA